VNAFLIKNGVVYHPEHHACIREDIAVEDGRIAAVDQGKSYTEIDAEGCIVTPGLIDFHVHYFNRGTENGVNPDAASFPCGITTAVDGGSCGAAHYELYRQSVMAHSDVRILNYLLMASGGQITDQYPERLEAEYFDRDKIRRLFKEYPCNLAGLKIRMSNGIIAPEKAEESLGETVKLAGELQKQYEGLEAQVDGEKLRRYLCSRTRKAHVKLHTDAAEGFSIAERVYRYAGHGIYILW